MRAAGPARGGVYGRTGRGLGGAWVLRPPPSFLLAPPPGAQSAPERLGCGRGRYRRLALRWLSGFWEGSGGPSSVASRAGLRGDREAGKVAVVGRLLRDCSPGLQGPCCPGAAAGWDGKIAARERRVSAGARRGSLERVRGGGASPALGQRRSGSRRPCLPRVNCAARVGADCTALNLCGAKGSEFQGQR